MANIKISEMTPATTPLGGTELVEIVQGGANKSVSVTDIRGTSEFWDTLVDFSGSLYAPTTSYQHPRGESELYGDSVYASAAMLGYYDTMPVDMENIHTITSNIYAPNRNAIIQMKIWIQTSYSDVSFENTPSDYTALISSSTMPSDTSSLYTHYLPSNNLNVSSGSTIIVGYSGSLYDIAFSWFDVTASSYPPRHTFLLGTPTTNGKLVKASSGYFQSAFTVTTKKDIAHEIGYETGSNLLLNPGLETSGSSTPFYGWSVNSTSASVETSSIHSGNRAVKMIGIGDSWSVPQLLQGCDVTPNTNYNLSFWTRGDGVNSTRFAIYGQGTPNAYIRNVQDTGISSSIYQYFSYNFTTPSTVNKVLIFLVPATIRGAVGYFDDISLNTITRVKIPVPVTFREIFYNYPAESIVFDKSSTNLNSTNIQSAISELSLRNPTTVNTSSNVVSSTGSIVPTVKMPRNLYAVVGDTLQMFVRGVLKTSNPYVYPYTIESTVGNNYPRYFEYTPVLADTASSKTITFNILDTAYNIVSTGQTTLFVASASTAPISSKNILCLGDSLTAGGTWPKELYRRLTQTGGTPNGHGFENITFIGDKAISGYPSQSYVGFGGWTFSTYNNSSSVNGAVLTTLTHDKTKEDVGSEWADSNGKLWKMIYATSSIKVYNSNSVLPISGTLIHSSGATHTASIVYTSSSIEAASPFNYGNSFSLSSWATRNGYSTIDAVYVLLAWNNIASPPNKTDFSSLLSDVRTFLDKLHSDFPNAIVRILGPQLPSTNGGLGSNYGSSGTSEYYGIVRNVFNCNDAFQSICDEPAYDGWVKFINLSSQFDSEYNMPFTTKAVNTRSNITESLGTNGVHPSTEGYYQIADAVYREFIHTFCS